MLSTWNCRFRFNWYDLAMMKTLMTAATLALIAISSAQADVVASAPDHFTLKLEATAELSPDEVWARLIEPAERWQSDHT